MNKLFFMLYIILIGTSANAHFLTLIPTTDNVTNNKESTVTLMASFIHPFEQTGMTMEKPKDIYVDSIHNALVLKETTHLNHKAWQTKYKIKKPGVYKFFVEPKPYFEVNEEKFISHVPKVIVSAYGLQAGWDNPIGLKYEIIPWVKPFALYSGNLFQGQVLHKGKPVANIEVEVELYNEFGLKAPTASHITQSVKTNKEGLFSFVINHKGWWGFAALIMEGQKEYKGKSYPVENGALLWIKAY